MAVFADTKGDSVTFAVTAGKDAQGLGIMSGKLVSAIAAIAGGKGGGRPDFAMAGAKDAAKAGEAVNFAEQALKEILG